MRVKVDDLLAQIDAPDNQEWRRFQVDYPEATLDGFALQHFTVEPRDRSRILNVINEGAARDTGSGRFTRLVERTDDENNSFVTGGLRYRVWMSDTRAEIMEHYPLFSALSWAQDWARDQRILVNGLGLGLAVHGALTFPQVSHVDVVEINPTVAELISSYLPADKVTVHIGDALTMKWPKGTRWDYVWSDIWPTISDDNLPQMIYLKRKYASRASSHWAWQEHGCRVMAKIMKQMEAGTLPPQVALDFLGGKLHL